MEKTLLLLGLLTSCPVAGMSRLTGARAELPTSHRKLDVDLCQLTRIVLAR